MMMIFLFCCFFLLLPIQFASRNDVIGEVFCHDVCVLTCQALPNPSLPPLLSSQPLTSTCLINGLAHLCLGHSLAPIQLSVAHNTILSESFRACFRLPTTLYLLNLLLINKYNCINKLIS